VRTSGTSDPLTSDLVTMPTPAPGYGVSFKAWPFERGRLNALYVEGSINDMNSDPTTLDPQTLLKGQFFYGLGVGYHWKRDFPKDFDHVHLDVWYADKRTDPYDVPVSIPNKAGWGFKLAASKQCGRLVMFGKFAHNTAEGGGIGLTWAENSATVGAALIKPAGVTGELGLSVSWMDSLLDAGRSQQHGVDAYWRILVTPNLFVTPGVQFVFGPVLNPGADVLTILGLKMRWFF
jgi:hypothetical protein